MISVCMASYNGEKFIKEQIMSIISQLSEDDELIISDDGSNDKTIEVISNINDDRIKVIKNFNHDRKKRRYSPSHYKVTKNFENALLNAKGDYIFLADQDDIWYSNKIETFLNVLKTNVIAVSNYSIINECGDIVKERKYTSNPIYSSCIKNLYNMSFHGCCMAFRKELLYYILPFPKDLVSHDNWIGLYANILGFEIGYIENAMIKYRRHNCNVSVMPTLNKNPFVFKLYYRIYIFIYIIISYLSKIKQKQYKTNNIS